MRLATGDLVKLSPIAGKSILLTSSPSPMWAIGEIELGKVGQRDVCIIVALERHDARSVYVIGPTGGGWIPGAFLMHVITK